MSRRIAVGLALTLSFASGRVAAQDEGGEEGEAATVAEEAPPPVEPDVMRYPPSSVRLPLILGGTFVTGAAYGLSVASARTWTDVPGADAMLVPIVGPWIALGQNGCAPDDPDCGAILWLRGILLVVDGIAQAGGLGLIAEGIFMTTEADAGEAPKASWTVAPIITPTQTGLGLVGAF